MVVSDFDHGSLVYSVAYYFIYYSLALFYDNESKVKKRRQQKVQMWIVISCVPNCDWEKSLSVVATHAFQNLPHSMPTDINVTDGAWLV